MLLRQNAELRQHVMLNTRFLQELLKNQKVLEGLAAGKLPDNVQLPLKSQDDLHKLQQQIVSQEIFRQLVMKNYACSYMEKEVFQFVCNDFNEIWHRY